MRAYHHDGQRMGINRQMAANGKSHGNAAQHGKSDSADTPAWADGLKQLYDNVVDEPLPDTFKDLLAQLDADTTGSGDEGSR